MTTTHAHRAGAEPALTTLDTPAITRLLTIELNDLRRQRARCQADIRTAQRHAHTAIRLIEAQRDQRIADTDRAIDILDARIDTLELRLST
jgi:hypothetical protein